MWKIRAKLVSILRTVMQVRKSSVPCSKTRIWVAVAGPEEALSPGSPAEEVAGTEQQMKEPELFVLERSEDGALGSAQK